MKGRALTDAVLADYRTAPIDERFRALLGFVEKLNSQPRATGAADVRAVLAAGVTRRGIEEALYVVAMFSMITRCADAFGFAIPDQAGFDAGARSLLRFGYAL